MNILSTTENSADINITENELLILNSALNEICNGIDIAEFETRIGAEKDDVFALLNKIGIVLDKLSS